MMLAGVGRALAAHEIRPGRSKWNPAADEAVVHP